MSLSTSNFSLQELEARFEMQCVLDQQDASGGGGYSDPNACGGGGGGAYDYYGGSWGDAGSGNGYVGPYQTSSDGSYAVLDDGTYTDGTSGYFPGYGDNSVSAQGFVKSCYCVICRCRF
jgi:hypothetical protein